MNLEKNSRAFHHGDVQLTLSRAYGAWGTHVFATGRYYKDDGYLFGKRVIMLMITPTLQPVMASMCLWIQNEGIPSTEN